MLPIVFQRFAYQRVKKRFVYLFCIFFCCAHHAEFCQKVQNFVRVLSAPSTALASSSLRGRATPCATPPQASPQLPLISFCHAMRCLQGVNPSSCCRVHSEDLTWTPTSRWVICAFSIQLLFLCSGV